MMTETAELNAINGRPATGKPTALPTAALLGSVTATALLIGGGWTLVAWLTGADQPVAGFAAGSLVALCTAAGLLAIMPWKPRPVSLWISLWLGQTVVRMLLTPVLTYLLYSATSLGQSPLFLAVGLTYLATILCEAKVLATFLRRSDPAAGSGSGSS